MNIRTLGAISVSLALASASAETIVWQDAAAGETAEYGSDLTGANTLKVPAGTQNAVAAAQLYYATKDGDALTFDGTDATMNLPARSDGFAYADPAWSVTALTPLAKLTRLTGTTATDAALSAENALFTAAANGTASSLSFVGGTWTSSGYSLDLVSGTDKDSGSGSVSFSGGTYTLGQLQFSGSTRADNALYLTNGVNMTVGTFYAPLTGNTVAHTNRVVFAGAETKLSATSSMKFAGGSTKRVTQVVVEDGAKLALKYLEAGSAQETHFLVRNGAHVHANGYKMGFSTSGENIHIVVNDSAWTMPVGTGYDGYFGGWGDCSMHATNSTVVLNGTVRGVGEWHFDSCEITNFVFTLFACHGTHKSCVDALFKDCTILNPWQNYARMEVSGDPRTATGESRMTFDGGTADTYTLGAGTKSAWASGNGRIVMKNGADVWTHGSQAGTGVYGSTLGVDGTGVVEVVGATWRMSYFPKHGTVFGKNAGSRGVLKIGTGGVVSDTSDTGGITFGESGDGELEVKGGTFATKALTLASGSGSKGTVTLEDCTLTVSSLVGGSGTSSLTANGATITYTAAGSLLSNLGSVTVGAKGLELSSNYEGTLAQDVSPATGADATLTLSGSGAKTLSGTISVPHLVVRGCRLVVAEGADLSATTLSLLDGATLAMADNAATALTLKGLVLGDDTTYGTIEADVSDCITLTEAPVIGNGMVSLSGTYANDSYALLVCASEIPSATATAWSAAYLSGGRLAGRAYAFDTVSAGGQTSFRVVVSDAVPVTETARWTASGASAAWETTSNWENDTPPSATSAATFDVANAAPTVTLATTATAGAILFDTATEVTIQGEGSISIADSGTGRVAVEQGTHSVDVPIVMPSETEFAVAAGSTLTVGGRLVNGAVNKTGAGKLVLESSDNRLISGITVGGGVVEAASAAALGYNAGVTLNNMLVSNASVRIGTTLAQQNLGHPLTFDPGTGKVAELVTAGDVAATMTTEAFKSGFFVKRGAGKLELTVAENQITSLGSETDNYSGTSDLAFPDDNAPTTTAGLCAFTVAEGEVCLKAGGAKARVQMTQNKAFAVGVSSQQIPESACPTLTLDGVSFDPAQHRGRAYVAYGTYPARTAQICCKNGAKIHFMNSSIGGGNHAYLVEPELVFDGGSARLNSVDLASKPLCTTYLTVKNGGWIGTDSAMYIGTGSLVGRFDNGLYMYADGKDSGSGATPQNIEYVGSEGTSLDIAFDNGSIAYLLKLVHKSDYANDMRLAFGGGSTWLCGANDVDLSIRASENAHIELLEGGMNLAVESGKTFATCTRFDGVGGLVKSGAGTLRFGRRATLDKSSVATELADVRTWCFTGTLVVNGGTVEVAEGAAAKETSVRLAAGTYLDLQGGSVSLGTVSGAGTVRNGTVSGRLAIGMSDAQPTFASSCTLPEKIVLDFGRTAANPVDCKATYAVGTFECLAAGVYDVRVIGTGWEGRFHARMTVDENGAGTISGIHTHGLSLTIR